MTKLPTFAVPYCWFRHEFSITRAYGCTLAEADGIAEPKTAFQKAVSVLGPIRAWKGRDGWMLDQRPADAGQIIAAASAYVELRTGRDEAAMCEQWIAEEE